jgi:hypothetical protein
VLWAINGADQTVSSGPLGSLTLAGVPHEGGIAVDSATHTVYVGTGNQVRRFVGSANAATPFASAAAPMVTSGALTTGSDYTRRFAYNNGKLYLVVNDVSANVGFRILSGTFLPAATGTLVAYPSPTEVSVDASTGLVFAASAYQSGTPLIRAYDGTTLKGSISVPGLVSAPRLAAAPTTGGKYVYYVEDPYCDPVSAPNCNGGHLARFSYTYTGGVFTASSRAAVTIGSPPMALGYNPANQRIYATMPSGGDVSIVDAVSGTEIDNVSLATPTAPYGASSEFAVNAPAARVYFATVQFGNWVKVMAECNPVDDPPTPCPLV